MTVHGFSNPRRGFGAVLAVLVAALIFQLATPDGDLARLITILLQGVVVLAALRAAGAERRLQRGATVAVVLLLGLAAVAMIGPGDIGPAIPRAFALALVLVAPVAVIVGLTRELREHGYVTVETVVAGLCLYLLLGLAFAFVFALVEDLGAEPFFTGISEGTPNDFLYYSLSTLTTTGYGDLTAGTELARTFSVTEALAGQIYLVTVVALLVSNLRRFRPSDG